MADSHPQTLPSPPVTAPLQTRHPETGQRIVLRLTDTADRQGHEFVLVNADGTIGISLVSVEGDGTSHRSPPIRQWVTESRPESTVVLGVGQADTHHWSASFEAATNASLISAHLACRMTRDADWPGSMYRWSTGRGLLEPQSIVISSNDQKPVLRFSAGDGTAVARNLADGSFQFLPVAIPEQFPATVQWRYTVEFA